MQQKSVFQQQYPLDSKKFWKKIISKSPPLFLSAIFAGAIGGSYALLFIVRITDKVIVDKQTFPIVLITIIIFIGLIEFIVYVLYVRVYIDRYYYSGGEDFLTIKKGVFAPTEIHVQYQKIQDVYVDQDVLDRIMGLYDVHIASATVTSSIEAHIDGVQFDVAEGIKNFLLDKIRDGKASPAATFPQQQVQVMQPQITTNFSEVVSNETHPISKKWPYASFVNFVLASLLLILFFGIFIADALFVPHDKYSKITFANQLGVSVSDFIMGAFIIFFVLVTSMFLYRYLWIKNYRFKFLQEYIFMRTGVFGRQEIHMPYNTIQNILVFQRFGDRIFSIGDVIIQNAATTADSRKERFSGDSVTISMQDIQNANKIAEELRSVLLTKNMTNSTGL